MEVHRHIMNSRTGASKLHGHRERTERNEVVDSGDAYKYVILYGEAGAARYWEPHKAGMEIRRDSRSTMMSSSSRHPGLVGFGIT